MRRRLIKSVIVTSMDEPTARLQLRETYGSLVGEGDGEVDFIATVKHPERLSGLGKPKL